MVEWLRDRRPEERIRGRRVVGGRERPCDRRSRSS